jgi:hypothetical protein
MMELHPHEKAIMETFYEKEGKNATLPFGIISYEWANGLIS